MSGLQFINNGLLTFTDGSYLHLGCRIITNDELSSPSQLYKKFTGGYNPQTGEFVGDELPIMVCIRDTTNNTKIAGFNGEKIDSNGNKWNFGLNSLVIKDENDNIIFSQSIPSYHNAYTIGYSGNQLVLVSGIIPSYEDTQYDKEFYGVNGIAAGGSAGTVFNDYFKDEVTFFSFTAHTGIFENYNQSDKNDFIKSPVVIANQINAYAQRPSSTTYSWASQYWAITGATLPEPMEDPNNPYDGGGTTSTGGGNGTFDPSGDTIGVPSLPTISAIDTGFVSIWKPTKTELKNLYNYLWSGLDLNTFKKIFANPIDTIMGFSIIPLTPTTGTAKELKVGNIGTGINVTPVTEQYYEIDCGTITIPEFFGSYLDYEPYTTIDLYLPYIGSVRISTDDIKRNPPNNGTIQLIYHIDILSGSCVVFVVTNGTVSYQYNGSILTQLPITGNDFTSTINSVLGLTSNIVGGVMSASTGNAAGVLGNSVNAAHNVTSAKPTINRSGNISGSGGFLGIQKPFLIMNLPKQAIAFAQNTFTGYPAHITNSVKSLTGYTEFEQIWIEKVPATENELSEIESILTSGVIL